MRFPAVTGVVVTRGDVDLAPILDRLGDICASVQVWDNSKVWDAAVFGRYLAAALAPTDAVYVQDDDCLIDAAEIICGYEPGRLVANMPRTRWDDYPDSAMVGWGAVFDRHLPWAAFARYATRNPIDSPTFRRTCDVVFSALTPRTVIDAGFQHLPWAETEGRMFRQPDHKPERDQVLDRCRQLRIGPDDDRRS